MEEKAEETIYQICSVCRESKPLSEFYRDKTKKLGWRTICKKCQAIKDKKRYEVNRKHILEQRKQYCCDHKEKISKQGKKYYLKHKERISKRKKKYNCEHKEEITERRKKYYLKHKEQIHEEGKKYRQEHKEQISEREKKYYREHMQKVSERDKRYRQTKRGSFLKRQNNRRRRVRLRALKRDLTSNQWQRILKNQRYKCNLCHRKFTKTRPATVDHIIPLSKEGGFTSSNVQALCKSCNCSKNAKTLKGFINSWCL